MAKVSGAEIPKPDYVRDSLPNRDEYEEQGCDTAPAAVMRRSYTPGVLSVEEELMAAHLAR